MSFTSHCGVRYKDKNFIEEFDLLNEYNATDSLRNFQLKDG